MNDAPPRRPSFRLRLNGREVEAGRRTLVVGVLNVTPDSFYDGGRFLQTEDAAEHGLKLIEQGADLLDIGAESSRPGARPVPQEEELGRLLPVLKRLRPRSDIPLMVDTCKAPVAQAALDCGADAINDISAFRLDPQMPRVVAGGRAGVVLMHMRGTPRTMQKIDPSPDILGDIDSYFEHALAVASDHGIERDRIVLDPGIGFGKTVQDNLRILNRLSFLQRFRLPILIGTSRKSFIGKILGLPAAQRLMGTAASVAAAVLRGAHLVRVHDVAAMKQVVDIADAILAERGKV